MAAKEGCPGCELAVMLTAEEPLDQIHVPSSLYSAKLALADNWKSQKAETGTGTETETGMENWERSSGALVILVQIG